MEPRVVFVDVDTQVDFMLPTGSLHVPGAERLIPNLARLMTWAREHNIPVLSTADAHARDDPEFAHWPPHCVVGTAGQQRIPETQLPAAVVVSNRPGAFVTGTTWPAQIVIEKQDYCSTSNPNFDTIVKALGPRRFVVFGVATEFCIRAHALALKQRGLTVELVTDAIMPITEKGGRKAIEEMLAAGVLPITIADVCPN